MKYFICFLKQPSFLLVLFLFSSGYVFSQDKIIEGTITDKKTGSALLGVIIKIEGTNIGAASDYDGKFSLKVPKGSNSLVVSILGYKKQIIKIDDQTQFNIVLSEDITTLSDIVVSALGVVRDKKKLGSTSSYINAESAIKSGETGIINSLSGKASGVRIARPNGDPGAGSTIQIRGFSSISGDYQPLIIMDGVPISNDNLLGTSSRDGGTSQQSRLNDINPNDIESISILKGASAAALWGSRAANGVIVIKTKQGSKGKWKGFRIELSSSWSFDKINTKHPLQKTWGQGSNGRYSPTNSRSWGDKISERSGAADVLNISGQYFEANNGTKYYPITTKNSIQVFTDSNFDAVFQNGSSNNTNLSISGGDEKSNVFLSVGKLYQKGIIKNSFYDKTMARLNHSYRLNDFIRISTKISYSGNESNRIQQSSNVSGLYLGLLRNAPDFDIRDYKGTYVNSAGIKTEDRHRSYRRYLGNSTNPTYNNPMWTVNEQKSLTDVKHYTFSSEIVISPKQNLDIIMRGGIDTYNDIRRYLFPRFSASTRRVGTFNEDIYNSTETNFDIIARYSKKLNANISFDGTLGWNFNDRNRKRNWTEANTILGTVNPEDLFNFINYTNKISENSLTRRRSNRMYGVFNFGLYEQVFVNFSGAYEVASTIKDPFFYPSVDIAWQFSKIPVIAEMKWLSFGKLRVSYGQVGVQPSPYKFATTYEGFVSSTYSDGLDVSSFGGGFRLNDDKGNPNLKPEIKTETEIGTDLELFDSRLKLSFTYYKNNVKDLLIDVPQPQSTGFNNTYDNAGSLENKGIEFDFDASVYNNKKLSIGIYGNFNKNKSEILDLKGTRSIVIKDVGSVDSRAVVGHSYGVLYGTQAKRYSDGSLDLDNNGYPQVGPIGVIGDPNPDWRGGIGLRASYKNFNFNILFEHSQGGDFSERTRFILANFGTHADVEGEVTLPTEMTNIANKVYPAGSVVRGTIKNFGAKDVVLDQNYYTTIQGFGDSVINEFTIADATWTRLREITLSYRLNSEKFQKLTKINSVDISVTGRNLFLWTGIVGTDPEINWGGVSNGYGSDYFTNPSTKSWVISLRVTY